MNITSCDCGVVLDKNKLNFPDDITDADGCVDAKKAEWDRGEWVAKTSCPVCGSDILQSA